MATPTAVSAIALPSNTVNQLVEFQRKLIAVERAAIVRFLRRRLTEGGPRTAVDVAELTDAIEAGAHMYDHTLFSERPPRT